MKILTLIKAPNAPAQRHDLPTNERAQLAAMQTIVGGYIEVAVRGRDFVVWCNEEGKLVNLPPNFHRPQDLDLVVGTVLVTGPIEMTIDGGVPTALTEESAARVARLLELWSEAGILCGTMPQHYDPQTDEDWERATATATRRNNLAIAALTGEMTRRRGGVRK